MNYCLSQASSTTSFVQGSGISSMLNVSGKRITSRCKDITFTRECINLSNHNGEAMW